MIFHIKALDVFSEVDNFKFKLGHSPNMPVKNLLLGNERS